MLIDTSTIVKFFCKEPNWQAVLVPIAKAATIEFALDELGNALLSKVRSEEMGMDLARDALISYQNNTAIFKTSEYREIALNIAFNNGITFYDSIFISAALKEKEVLITSDKRQAEVAERLGVTVEFIK